MSTERIHYYMFLQAVRCVLAGGRQVFRAGFTSKGVFMKSLTSFFVLLALCCPIIANAAVIEPYLEDQLWSAKPGEKFSVIVKLYNPRDISALDQELHAKQAKLAERHLVVIEALQANAAETQGPVVKELDALKAAGEVEGFKAYWIENLIVIYGTGGAILEIASNPAVESIGPNFRAELIEPILRGPIRGTRPNPLDTETTTPGQDAIHATQVNREMQITGQGVLVANCDTGVDGQHDALDWRWRGNHAPHAECWLDLLGGGGDTPTDQGAHGTHVMGTICGREINGNDTITVGSAPNAEWIATNAINQGVGPNFDQDILDAYEWFADPDGNPNTTEDVPDVIQNSWGVFTGLGYAQCFSNWNTAINNCEAAGAVITWSAGNESTSGLRSPAIYSINHWQIFSVGAVDATNFNAPYPIADFSSRGPTPCQPAVPDNIKPEVSAPGVDVYSSIPGNQYTNGYSGTSMAGPHVAGAVALMREACPDCDPQTIKEALMATCIDYGQAGEDNTYGHGFIDAYAAVQAVFSLGRVDGFVTTGAGTPIEGVRVQSLDATNFAMSHADGYYNLSAPAGTHTIRYTKFGYETVTIPNITTVEGDTVHQDVEMNTVPSGILAGTVVTQAGVPIQNAIVVIENTPIDTMVSDGAGHITVNLPATTYSVYLEMTVNTTPPQVFSNTVTVQVQVGDTTHAELEIFIDLIEPAGPDAYGYRAYDRYDRDFPAPGEWVELDPDLGNPGVVFEFDHHDSALFMPTPFSIGFYGEDHDTLTVNPNGWMRAGEDHTAGATNQTIPSTSDPAGIIAPYWDDFRIGLGARQFQYYDDVNGRWIFEFLDQRLVTPGNRFHDWEVHFLDPARYASATGDCDIVFLYHRTEYKNSCTIGIESPAENTGIRILYNTALDSTSWPIENGAAIRFTTGRATGMGNMQGTITLHPASGDITTADVWAGGAHTHPAANGAYLMDSVAAAPVAVALHMDGYEWPRANRVVVTNGGTATTNLTAWRLDPARNLSAWQYNGVVHLSWEQPLSVIDTPNPDVRYHVYAYGVLAASNLTELSYSETRNNLENVSYSILTTYRYGQSEFSDTLNILVDLGANDPNLGVPTEYALYQNYPNPFNPSTQIRFDVPETADATLMIYDITGRLVRTLYDGTLNAGRYTFAWDSKDDHGAPVSTGVYLYRLNTTHYSASQKMLLVK